SRVQFLSIRHSPILGRVGVGVCARWHTMLSSANAASYFGATATRNNFNARDLSSAVLPFGDRRQRACSVVLQSLPQSPYVSLQLGDRVLQFAILGLEERP